MPDDDLTRAERDERLRQRRETFDQRRDHDERWFSLRIAMGWTALIVMPVICGPAAFVIFNYDQFHARVIALASAALVTALGLFGAAWRLVLGNAPPALTPVADPVVEESEPPKQRWPAVRRALRGNRRRGEPS
jgi:hypothetical protein